MLMVNTFFRQINFSGSPRTLSILSLLIIFARVMGPTDAPPNESSQNHYEETREMCDNAGHQPLLSLTTNNGHCKQSKVCWKSWSDTDTTR